MYSYDDFLFICDDKFQSDEEIKEFVLGSEEFYIQQVLNIANDVISEGHIRFLTLSGPSCSGKTTTSHILEDEFEKKGISVKIVSIDDFYRSRAEIALDDEPDYESITAIDFEYFKECIDKILQGETAMLPIYDFVTGKRSGYTPHVPSEHEIIIFEGIQALYPEIVATLPRNITKSIYISVDKDINAYGTYFNKREVRFLRRLVRDYLFRASSPAHTMDLWQGVVENEEKNIVPNKKNADYVINSFLPYELGVIKPYTLQLISYNMDDPMEKALYYSMQEEFKDIIEIPSRFIPKDSVFREFIGKEDKDFTKKEDEK